MAWLTKDELKKMQFKSLGNNVLISDKSAIYNPEMISIGDNSRIDDFCVISGNVTIGNNVHIAVFNNVAGGEVGIILDDFSGLAYGCHVFTQSDDYNGNTLTNPTVPDEFKDDFNLSILAVKQNGLSISFVEGVLRKNKEIIIEAIKQNRESYDFIDNSMKLDKDVSAAFMKYSMI